MMIRERLHKWIVFGIVTYLLAGCAGLAGEPAIVATFPPQPTSAPQTIRLPQSPPDVAQGAQIYAENCTRCHGVSGQGDGEMVQSGQVTGVPDFTNPQTAQDAAPVAWFEIVTNGRLDKLMPPWGEKLSEAQRWAVTMYVYTLANTSDQIAQGQAVWTATCAECHGAAGEGTEKGAPLPNLLESSNADLLQTLAVGIPDKMPALADELSVEERTAALAYARTLTLTNAGGSPHEVASAPTAGAGATPQPASTEESGAANTTPQPATTEQPGGTIGVISGTVSNMTDGGSVPADLTLNLHVVSSQDSASPGEVFHTTLNTDNTYRFENVPVQVGSQYVVTTSYSGTAFSSEVVDGNPANPQIDLPLNIYESGDDPANIQIDGLLTMVQARTQPDQLEIVQIYSFTNVSDRVFMKADSGTPTSVSVRLPQGAAFEDLSRGNYLVSADGTQVTDTQPVLPGNAHVMHLAFTMPYSSSASIEQAVNYQLEGPVEVMVGSDSLSVSGSGITQLGARQLGDRTYMSYGGNLSVAAGDLLRYQVQGAVAAAPAGTAAAVTANTISPLAYILIGAGLLAIGAAFGFFLRERATAASAPARETATPQANALMKRIADLDIQFNDGKLSKGKYERQRAALKAQLVALMKDQSESPS